MEDVQELINAFREARIVGEKLLSQGKITWDRLPLQWSFLRQSCKAWGNPMTFFYDEDVRIRDREIRR